MDIEGFHYFMRGGAQRDRLDEGIARGFLDATEPSWTLLTRILPRLLAGERDF